MAFVSFRLLYLPVRARAENIKMMLSYAQIPFEDVMIPFDAFKKLKMMEKFPFGQLPVLQVVKKDQNQREVERINIAQSGSITRFVANMTHLQPSDPVEAALCDSYFEAAQDEARVNPIVNIFSGEKLQAERQKYLKRLPRFTRSMGRVLGEKQFLMGDRPMYCDFAVFHVLDQSLVVYPPALDDHPLLQSYADRVRELPGVKEYLTTRPPLHELGRAVLPEDMKPGQVAGE